MAVAAADWAVTAWLEWELCDFLAAISAGPRSFYHRSVSAVAISSATATRAIAAIVSETVPTLEAVEAVLARLKW